MKHYNKLVIYDYETNGFFSYDGKTQPIELGFIAIHPHGFTVFDKLFRPNEPISEKITEVTGITQEVLDAKGESWNEAIDLLHGLLNDEETLIIGHNSLRFDNQFSNLALDKKGYPKMIEENQYDTGGDFKAELLGLIKSDMDEIVVHHRTAINRIAKGVMWNLEAAAAHYQIELPDIRHRALEDVKLTAKVFMKQIDKYLNKDITIHEDTLSNLKSIL